MTSDETALLHDVTFNLAYKIRLGTAWTRFMRGLLARELWASRCNACERTYVPPKSYCESCFEAIDEWLQVEPVGTIKASTIVYQGFEGGPEAPYAIGAIEIDGTDSMLMHFVGLDLSSPTTASEALRRGARVRAHWAEERSAAITDIAYFELV